jgi:hypothetical protein
MVAHSKNMPNFLIVGAAKAGTTSLYEYLRQHPDIFMPQWKELSFFIGDPCGPLHRVKKARYYFKVFAEAQGHKAVGEASTSYLSDEAAAGIIRNKLGEIKIIIILRDPVAMSYSLYNHQLRKEGETCATFESALEAEENRRQSLSFRQRCYGWHANYYYYHRGLYFEQVKRYLDTFGKDRVKIILFEELAKATVEAVQDVYRFLSVDHTFVPEIRVHNPAGGIVNIPRFWEDTGLFLKTYQFLFSKNVFKKIPHLARNIGRKAPRPINPATAHDLRQKYHTDICRLEQLIGKDLAAWKN